MINGIKRGDQKSFAALVSQYQSLVLNTSYHFLQDKNDAEDLTQEVFIEVYSAIHRFKNEAKISTWLYRITVNKSLNFLRGQKKKRFFENMGSLLGYQNKKELQIPDESQNLSEEQEIQNKRLEILNNSIRSLSKQQRTAFTLHKLESLSYQQIAEVMDLSLSAVEGLIHRAKINVKKEILKYYEKK